MAIASKLVELYKEQGITICTGLNPLHYGGLKFAPYTWYIKDGYSHSTGLGIALQEIYLLEHLLSAKPPQNALIVGNAMGWSSIAISVIAPKARVIGIDTGTDEQSRYGIELTNRIAKAHKLNLMAVVGTSPQDVRAVCRREFEAPIDFVFIDGLHTNEQIVKDFIAAQLCASEDCVFLFHDVREGGLGAGLDKIRKIAPELEMAFLGATPSGMALLYKSDVDKFIRSAVAAFVVEADAEDVISKAIQISRNRWRDRLYRSAVKRYNFIARIVGLRTLPVPGRILEGTMKT